MVHLNDDAFLSFSDKRIPRTLGDVIVSDKLSKKQNDQIVHVVSLFHDVFQMTQELSHWWNME